MLHTNRKAIQLHGIDHLAGFCNHPVISTRYKIYQLIQPPQIIIAQLTTR